MVTCGRPAQQPTAGCHTAVPGEECHGAVTWALNEGFDSHPDWYPGLHAQSTFEDFQRLLHKGGHGPGQNGVANYAGCALPCALRRSDRTVHDHDCFVSALVHVFSERPDLQVYAA